MFARTFLVAAISCCLFLETVKGQSDERVERGRWLEAGGGARSGGGLTDEQIVELLYTDPSRLRALTSSDLPYSRPFAECRPIAMPGSWKTEESGEAADTEDGGGAKSYFRVQHFGAEEGTATGSGPRIVDISNLIHHSAAGQSSTSVEE